MPRIPQFDAGQIGLRPTEIGVDARAAAARRIGATFNQVAGAKDQLAGTTEKLAHETQHLGRETEQLGSETSSLGDFKGRLEADMGRRLGGAIASAGQAYDNIQTHDVLSKATPAAAQLQLDLTHAWNDAQKADPNDTSIAGKFRETQLDPALDKFKEAFGGTEKSRAWAEHYAETLRSHFYQTTDADMAKRSADAIAVNYRQMSNTWTNIARTDPSQVDALIGTDGKYGLAESSLHAIISSSPSLRGTDASKLAAEELQKAREQIVKAGALGAIEKSANPEAAAKVFADRYPKYINAQEIDQLTKAAKVERNAARADQERALSIQDKMRKEQSEGVRDDYIKRLYSDDPKAIASVSARNIVNDQNLTVQDKEHLVGVVKRELKPETDARTSAQTSVEIIRAMRDPNADPQKINAMIFDARTKDPGSVGSLTKTDMADLQKQLVDLKTPEGAALAAERNEFFKRYAPAIDPTMGSSQNPVGPGRNSALGNQKLYEAEKAARRAENDARARNQDPHSVYDPSSPNFFGRPENILRFRASMQDAQTYQARIEKADALPKVGEVKDGYTFKGGDPSKPESWSK